MKVLRRQFAAYGGFALLAGASPSIAACGAAGEQVGAHDGGRDAVNAYQGVDASSVDGNVGCKSGEPGVTCLAATDETHLIAALTVDDENLYWIAQGPATSAAVMMAPRAGGAAITLADITDDGFWQSLASDGRHVYWRDSGDGGAGSIMQIPVTGGTPVTVARATSPTCIASDGSSVYWTQQGGGVVEAPIAGGTPTTLYAGGRGGPLVVDSTDVYFVDGLVLKVGKHGGSAATVWDPSPAIPTPGSGCRQLAISAGTLVVMYGPATDAPLHPQLGSMPVTGTTTRPTVLVTGSMPSAVVAGVSEIFWLGLTNEVQVNQTPLSGGPTTTLATPNAPYAVDIALASDGTVYWATDVQIESRAP